METIYSDLNPRLGQSRNPDIVVNELAINSAIENIIGTNLGERWYVPNFGCDLAKLLFDPISPTTALIIKSTVLTALKKWEPRAEFLSSTFVIPNVDAQLYMIEVHYNYKGYNYKFTANLNKVN
jgi:phage baseplate assembly protein W